MSAADEARKHNAEMLKSIEGLKRAPSKVCLGCGRDHRPFHGPDSPLYHVSQSFCVHCSRHGPVDPNSWEIYERLTRNAVEIAEAQEDKKA